MNVLIKAHNVRLSDSLRAYIEERMTKLERLDDRVVEAKVELRSEQPRSGGEQCIAQITILTPGRLLRSEERDHDERVAVDRALDKMKRQIARYHDRRTRRARRGARSLGELAADQAVVAVPVEELEESPPSIVRTKQFAVKPIDTEEAIEQMELLGHSFFVFLNQESGRTNVIYRRSDGQIGLIDPVLG